MEDLPALLRMLLSEIEVGTVREWWDQLAPLDRQALVAAYDDRWEDCFFGPIPDGETAPAVLGGRFLPADDACGWEEWETDWREYLIEHPNLSMSLMFRTTTWHVHTITGAGAGTFTIWVEWTRTRLRIRELPPSAQQRPRTSRCM